MKHLWQNIKKIVLFLLWIYSLLADTVTYLSGKEQVRKVIRYLPKIEVPDWLFYVNTILCVIAVLILVYVLLYYVTLQYRRNIGTNNIPCSFAMTLRYKCLIKSDKILYAVHHDIYHFYYRMLKKIREGKLRTITEQQDEMAGFLRIVHSAIYNSMKLDLTINVKKLIYRNSTLCLVPYAHFRSVSERNRPEAGGRNFHLRYYIEPKQYRDLGKNAEMAEKYIEENGQNPYEANSIFSYILANDQSCWMSNDLCQDERDHNFYTSSGNYSKYYKSMAVFAISPPEKPSSLPEGLLVFDANITGQFSEKECKNLFGYVAHLVYELFYEIEAYGKKCKKSGKGA